MNNLANKSTNNYRPEIDGLRALAVLSVVVFHVDFKFLSGGFTGVDIFYVISGYLISSIIFKSLISGNFSFKNFYIRRAKRLLPAAIFTILTTLFVSYFILTPDKYVELSKSAIYSAAFMANVWFMNNSGYFDLDTGLAPLVHLWSLAVEEQFYFVFPILAVLFYKYLRTKGIVVFIFLTTVTSFVLSVTLSTKFVNFSFYMLPTRAWELGLGSIVALLHLKNIKIESRLVSNGLVFIGLMLITYGFVFLDESFSYPSYWALFPVVGTVFIIYSSVCHNGVIVKILSNPGLVFVGKISYSTYLWHWPVVVLYRIYINERHFSISESCTLLLLSLILGYLSWKHIEERFRYKKFSPLRVLTFSLASTSLVILFSLTIYLNQGFTHRIPDSIIKVTDDEQMWNYSCTEQLALLPTLHQKFCVVGLPWKESQKKGVIWGDSHSLHMAPLMHRMAIKHNMSLVIAPEGCPPYIQKPDVQSYYPKFPNFTEDCTFRNTTILDFLKKRNDIKYVVMAAAWSGQIRLLWNEKQPENRRGSLSPTERAKKGDLASKTYFTDLISELHDKEILLIGDFPRPNENLNACIYSEFSGLIRQKCKKESWQSLNSQEIIKWHLISNERLKTLGTQFENIITVIPVENLCNKSTCPTYINGEFIYKDSNHIRRNLTDDTLDKLLIQSGIYDAMEILNQDGISIIK
jgi:peptidoglycan/LPS O-acetylase OafA/YrhL